MKIKNGVVICEECGAKGAQLIKASKEKVILRCRLCGREVNCDYNKFMQTCSDRESMNGIKLNIN